MDRRALRLILWLPLALFVGFVAVVATGLVRPPDTTVASKMVGQPVPDFSLPPALPDKPGLDAAALASGRPHLVNVFASWCLPCVAEAPQLMALRRAGVPIEGIAVRDRASDLAAFLAGRGDPYERIGGDSDSKVQMAWGSSGVPETFVVDGHGVIRAQHIGDIHADEVPELLATLRALR